VAQQRVSGHAVQALEKNGDGIAETHQRFACRQEGKGPRLAVRPEGAVAPILTRSSRSVRSTALESKQRQERREAISRTSSAGSKAP